MSRLLFGQLPNRSFPVRSHPVYSLVGAFATPFPPTPGQGGSGGTNDYVQNQYEQKIKAWVRGRLKRQDDDAVAVIQAWLHINQIANDS